MRDAVSHGSGDDARRRGAPLAFARRVHVRASRACAARAPRRGKSHARSKLGWARVRPAGAGPEPRVRRSRVRRGGGGAGRVLARQGRPRGGVPRASRGAGRAAGRHRASRRAPRLFVVVSRPRASFPRAAPAADALPREQRRGDVLERAGRAARFPARHRREPGHTAVRAPEIGRGEDRAGPAAPAARRKRLRGGRGGGGAAARVPEGGRLRGGGRRAQPADPGVRRAGPAEAAGAPALEGEALAVSRGVHRGRRGRAQRHALRQGVPRGNRERRRGARDGGGRGGKSERTRVSHLLCTKS